MRLDPVQIAWRAFFDASDRTGDFGFIVHSIATMIPYGQQT